MTGSNLIQAARGPLMLITLGVLIALDYAGVFGFSRTWPVLIIVFGTLKLLERVSGPTTPDVAAPPPLPYGPGGEQR